MCDSEYEFHTKNYLYLYELTHSAILIALFLNQSIYQSINQSREIERKRESFYNNYLVSWCRHKRVIDLYVNKT